jgi:L-ascorbate metabolism protein UlaG (beta-lactamase superfamily)
MTKLGHACLRLEKGSTTLVIDPGAFSHSRSMTRCSTTSASALSMACYGDVAPGIAADYHRPAAGESIELG